jgi:hypothetical protein
MTAVKSPSQVRTTAPGLESPRRKESPRWRNPRADRPRLAGELEVAMHEGDRYAAFTDGCCHALH